VLVLTLPLQYAVATGICKGVDVSCPCHDVQKLKAFAEVHKTPAAACVLK